MIDEPVAVGVLADEDEVAEVVAHYNLLAVPGRRRRRPAGRDRDRRRRHRHGPADAWKRRLPRLFARGRRRTGSRACRSCRRSGRSRRRSGGRDARRRPAAGRPAGAARPVGPPPIRVRGRSRPRPAAARPRLRDRLERASSSACGVGSAAGAGSSRSWRSWAPGSSPGIAGNDAGGITTYSVMGAKTGLTLLWLFPITIVILAVVQEMAARLGVVTGQGLSDLIRDRFGVRWTVFAMVVLLVANIANTVAEFSGAAAALEIFGDPALPRRPDRGRRDLGARAVRQLPDGRAGLPGGGARVRDLHRVGRPRPARLGRGRPGAGHARRRPRAAASCC